MNGKTRYARIDHAESHGEDCQDIRISLSGQSQDSSETLTEALDSLEAPPTWQRRRLLLMLAVFDILILTLAFSAFAYSRFGLKPMMDHELILATNSYSPLLSRTKIELRDERIKTALINRHNLNGESIYREPPSPEVDEAWRKLHKGDRLFVISEDEVLRMGKDPSGQHDIHCLNNLRMFAFAEHYYGNRRARLEMHALHCLHALLQTFQCKYSTDVYTAFWVEGMDAPIVDFDLTRKCQNYDNILDWGPEKPYTEEQFAALRPPPGQKRIPFDVY
ncbi:hypothetical protein GE09DRAFT_1281433 [Coniochaeta sp. 2T2.1]|nr:hypothetical protein GE09DRAFT_1281433 [Coniochaeta sp. 2T2.1]